MIHLFVFDCLVLGIPSVLLVPRHKTKDLLDKFSWNDIIEELKQRVPTLLHVLTTVAVPLERVATDHDVPALCTRAKMNNLINVVNNLLQCCSQQLATMLCCTLSTTVVNKHCSRLLEQLLFTVDESTRCEQCC